MKNVCLKPFLSAEWGIRDDKFITTQLGAIIEFTSIGVSHVMLDFVIKDHPVTFAIRFNDESWKIASVKDQQLVFNVPSELTRVYVMLCSAGTNSEMLWQDTVVVTSMFVDQGEVSQITYEKPYVTFVGDSISAGEDMAIDGNHPEVSYPMLVAESLGKPLNRIAYGGTGLTTHAPFQSPTAIEALWHVAENVERRRVETDLVIINYGTNDFNYGATVSSFAFGLRIYLLELIKRFHSAKMILMIPFNGAFRTVFQNEVARFDNFIIMETNSWLISTDKVHPSSDEHQQIAKQILKGI